MADVKVSEFPTAYAEALDEVLAGATFASAYNVQGAEFVNARQVSIPEIDFGSNPEPVAYDGFSTVGDATIERTVYTLDNDVEKVYRIDALDSIDEAAADATRLTSEWMRLEFSKYIDKKFFAAALSKAKTTGTTALTAANVKAEVRKARTQFVEAGLTGGNLYMTPTALGMLEDATERQWSNDTSITDTVGNYNGFAVYEVPSEILGADFIAISGGTQTIEYVTKRAVSYLFAPGGHTEGDCWLEQMRWVFGMIVKKNKRPGIYASKASA